MKYKTRLTQMKSLKETGIEGAFKRAEHCAALFKDHDFITDTGLDQFAIDDYLMPLVNDTALTPIKLVKVLEAFPDVEQWKSHQGGLHGLYHDAVDRSVNSVEREARPRRTVTLKEHEATLKEVDELKYACRLAREKVEEKDATIARLESENRDLIRQIATLEGRIVELERCREHAA